jgi:hypothetical protein
MSLPQMSDFSKLALTATLSAVGGLVVGVLLEPAKAFFKRRRMKAAVYGELASISAMLQACQLDGSMSLEIDSQSLAEQSRKSFLVRIERLRPKRIRHFLDSDRDSFYGIHGADEIEDFYTKVEAFVSELREMPYQAQVQKVWNLADLFKYYSDLGHIERNAVERHRKKQRREGLNATDNLCRSFAEERKVSRALRRFRKKYSRALRKDEVEAPKE